MRICLHLIGENVVVISFLTRIFTVQLILFFKSLVERSVVNGEMPLLLAEVNVAEETIYAAFEGSVFRVQFSR